MKGICRGILLPAVITVIGFPHANAAPPKYPDILAVSQLRAGMRGYGLTVFRGTKIERFGVQVVSVVRRGSLLVPGHDMILIRLTGGPITGRKAYMIRGMSGSPIYIGGKLIGAYSQAEPFTTEPLGGVTPMEDMLEAWDSRLPNPRQNPEAGVRTFSLAKPLRVNGRVIRRIVANLPSSSTLRSNGETLVLQRCSALVTVSGLSKAGRDRLAAALAPYGIDVAQGAPAGGRAMFKGSPLVPGAAFGMMLMTGDVSIGATGTITYRKGNRILGFGHPFLGIGSIEAPLTSAFIHDVYPLLNGSYKISSPGPTIGASLQDRNFSVSGIVGAMPKTIPIRVSVRDRSTGRSHIFRMQSVAHQRLYASAIASGVLSAIGEIRATPGDATAKVRTRVVADEVGTIERSNTVFGSQGIDAAATSDLDEIVSSLSSNPFRPVSLRSVEVSVDIESVRRTATIERVFVPENRYEPGQMVPVRVVLKPYGKPLVQKTVQVRLPDRIPGGRAILIVRGGAPPPPISLGGFVLRSAPPPNPDQAPPANLKQFVDRIVQRERGNEIVARLLLNSSSVNVDGRTLSDLPHTIDAVMRSARSSNVRQDRDEVKVVLATEYLPSGQHFIGINVVGKGGADSGAPRTPGELPGQPGVSPFRASASLEQEAAVLSGVERASIVVPPLAEPSIHPGQAPTAQDRPPVEAPSPGRSSANTSGEKPIGRQSLMWRLAGKADFERGKSSGFSVDSRGELVATSRLEPVCELPDAYVWKLAPDGKGGVFAATGPGGRILRIGSQGRCETYASLPVVNVNDLILEEDGSLLAATSPDGRTYRISPSGSFRILHQAPEAHALALARGAGGIIYVGTGGKAGAVYRIPPTGEGKLLLKTVDAHVLSLALGKEGILFAGTSGQGLLYRIEPSGKASIVHDDEQTSISALAILDDGTLVAGTAPRGQLWKLEPDSSAKLISESTFSGITSICARSGGGFFVAAGSQVLKAETDGWLAALETSGSFDITALAVTGEGKLFAGASTGGQIFAEAKPVTHEFVSAIHDAKRLSRWGVARWRSAFGGSGFRIETRSGNGSEPDSTWSEWAPASSANSSEALVASPRARFLQIRVLSDVSAAALSELTVAYLPSNQEPKVTLQSPSGLEIWSGNQTVRWQPSDPDRDTLASEVFYAPLGSEDWKPLPAAPGARSIPGSASASETIAPAFGGRFQTVEEVQAQLDKHADMPQTLKDALLARARENLQSAGQAPRSAPASPENPAGNETSRSLATTALPDGTYRVKVVVSDHPSNATGERVSQAISAPFTICNTLPILHIEEPVEKTAIRGTVVQATVAVAGVQFRVDGGEWRSAESADGLFDTSIELFAIRLSGLTPGAHKIEVKAFNAAGLSATRTVMISGI